jgi:hypothetical protein
MVGKSISFAFLKMGISTSRDDMKKKKRAT